VPAACQSMSPVVGVGCVGKLRACHRHADDTQMSADRDNRSTELPSGSASGRLTRERIRQLAEYLIAGRTRMETANALDVSPRTVSRWKKDPVVLAEVERLLKRGPETRALEKLERLLDSADDRVALGAAQTLVRREMQRLATTLRK